MDPTVPEFIFPLAPQIVDPAARFPEDHTRLYEIDRGATGIVEAWNHRPSNTIIAVKIVRTRTQRLFQEVSILSSLPRHDSIMQQFGYVQGFPNINQSCILSEYYPVGDLWAVREEMWARGQSCASEAFMWSIFNQLSSAIAFLHEGFGAPRLSDIDNWLPVMHRDIKLENVFVATLGTKPDWSGIVIKLGDFGLATYYNPGEAHIMDRWGTTCYWPPEQTYWNRRTGPEGDVWAVGCIIHELAHGYMPIVHPAITQQQWIAQGTPIPLGQNANSFTVELFWSAVTPRMPKPINLDAEAQEPDPRSRRPTPKYSDALNETMMMTLHMDRAHRIEAGPLYRRTEEEYGAWLFAELRSENEKVIREMKEEGSYYHGFG